VCFQDWLDFVGFQVRSKKCAPQVSILKRTGKASGYVLKLQETESSRVCFCASTATMDMVLLLMVVVAVSFGVGIPAGL
jgi:hypothetical protein